MKMRLLILLMAMSLLLIGAASAQEWTGDWYLELASLGESEISAKTVGYNGLLSLNEDGNAQITLNGTVQACTWQLSEDEIILTDAYGNDQLLTAAADRLVLVDDNAGIGLIFTRNAPEEAAYQIPERVIAHGISDFEGTWTAAYAAVNGMVFPAESIGVNLSFTFGAESSMVYEGGHASIEAQFSEGTLQVPAAGFIFFLNEDMNISLEWDAVNFYFVRSDENREENKNVP